MRYYLSSYSLEPFSVLHRKEGDQQKEVYMWGEWCHSHSASERVQKHLSWEASAMLLCWKLSWKSEVAYSADPTDQCLPWTVNRHLKSGYQYCTMQGYITVLTWASLNIASQVVIIKPASDKCANGCPLTVDAALKKQLPSDIVQCSLQICSNFSIDFWLWSLTSGCVVEDA